MRKLSFLGGASVQQFVGRCLKEVFDTQLLADRFSFSKTNSKESLADILVILKGKKIQILTLK